MRIPRKLNPARVTVQDGMFILSEIRHSDSPHYCIRLSVSVALKLHWPRGVHIYYPYEAMFLICAPSNSKFKLLKLDSKKKVKGRKHIIQELDGAEKGHVNSRLMSGAYPQAGIFSSEVLRRNSALRNAAGWACCFIG